MAMFLGGTIRTARAIARRVAIFTFLLVSSVLVFLRWAVRATAPKAGRVAVPAFAHGDAPFELANVQIEGLRAFAQSLSNAGLAVMHLISKVFPLQLHTQQ